MATTISPSAGAGVLFTQQGVGTSPGYSALDDRRADSQGLQEGVINASDFMVVQRGAGANMSVDIGMPAGGFACVQGDTINGQGLYTVPVHSATVNETVTSADPTNPRVDIVVLEVLDNTHDGGGQNLARVRVIAGTPTSGANLTNRTGVASLPASALLLADVLVGAAASSITNTVIRDRRKWGRGVYLLKRQNNGANYTRGTAGRVQIDTTNLSFRVECSGVPLRLSIRGVLSNVAAPTSNELSWFQDGVELADSIAQVTVSSAGAAHVFNVEYPLAPSAGSHKFEPAFGPTNANTMSVWSIATTPVFVEIVEEVRQNTANNTTTSG